MPTNFLTKEGFEKLQDELDYLRTITISASDSPSKAVPVGSMRTCGSRMKARTYRARQRESATA